MKIDEKNKLKKKSKEKLTSTLFWAERTAAMPETNRGEPGLAVNTSADGHKLFEMLIKQHTEKITVVNK